MPDEIAHAKGWFRKAENDLITAQRALRSGGPYDIACFHAQQAVERYLKGLLALRGLGLPRIHNLEELQRLGETAVPPWPLKGMDLTELTPYAVEMRYDIEFMPDRATTRHAVTTAEEVRRRVLQAVPTGAQP